MDISERIEKIKQYFVSFNIMAQDDAAYILLRLPNNWVVPDTKMIKETYAVEVAIREEGVYFLTEIANGTDKLFECAEMVVKYNKNIEERKHLLKSRIEELSNLFATEELEKLKTLRFTFDYDTSDSLADSSERKGKGKGKRATKVASEPNQRAEEVPFTAEQHTEAENTGTRSEGVSNEDNDDNGLMALAKNITGE